MRARATFGLALGLGTTPNHQVMNYKFILKQSARQVIENIHEFYINYYKLF